jgi:RNA polymerase sigma-70 factor (ECF subfamily)
MEDNTISDTEALDRFLNGDKKIFEIIIRRYTPKLTGYLFSKVKDPMLVDDMIQSVFVKLLKSIEKGTYTNENKLGGWLTRVAHNIMIDHFRAEKKLRTVSLSSPINGQDSRTTLGEYISNTKTEDAPHWFDELDLESMLEDLPEEQRDVITLRIYNGFSFKQIAEFTDESINTCLGRMRYALINLRKMIAQKELKD